jgi:hypothetical protein
MKWTTWSSLWEEGEIGRDGGKEIDREREEVRIRGRANKNREVRRN